MAKHRLFIGILTIYILLAGMYSLVNPLFESPDEIWHYEYVRWLVEGHGLAAPEDVGHAPWHQEGSQPPLYYLTAASITAWIPTGNAQEVLRYNPHAAVGQAESFGNKNVMVHGSFDGWPWRGVVLAAHVARFYSILLGAITVWATYATVRQLFPNGTSVALLAAAIVAFNPQFLFLSAAINNDNLVTCISAVGLWFGLRLVRGAIVPKEELATQRPTNAEVVVFGVIAGLAALSKLSGLLVSVYVAAALGLIAWHSGIRTGERPQWLIFRWGLISGTAMVIVSGWWYIRNWLLFGDPLALQAMFDILPRRAEPPSIDELAARAEGIWNSVWAVFGWFNVVVAPHIYWFYSALTILGIVGFAATLLSQAFFSQSSSQNAKHEWKIYWMQALLLVIWISFLLLSLWRWAQMRYPQGRLLFPALSALATLLAVGIHYWLSVIRGWRFHIGVHNAAIGVIIAVMIALAGALPWLYIVPTYQPIVSAVAPSPAPPNRDATTGTAEEIRSGAVASTLLSVPESGFDDQIFLTEARLATDQLQPGDRLTLTLKWKTVQLIDQDFSVFVHLIDENQILQAQRDSYPGQGNLPTSEWVPGEQLDDQHVIDVPITAPSPAKLKVNIGLYNFETGERLLINGSDHWTLGFVRLTPPAGDGTLPNSVFVNFEDQIALVGFEFDRYTMSPGDTLILKLWWEALAAPLRDTKVFTHLVLPPEATWAQDDDRPRAGTAKTDTWQLGDRIEDQYEMTLPEGAPQGVYFVEVGLYDGETYKRLKVNFSDKGTVIGQVRVVD